MSTNHTPGPWQATAWGHVTAQEEEEDGFTVRVAHVQYLNGEEDANARLIAAAPDLLAELERLADWVVNNVAYGGGEGTLDSAYAAIRRAHGTDTDYDEQTSYYILNR
jgi:hypothetical protein